MGTEFADNKSLNEPFPAEWGQLLELFSGLSVRNSTCSSEFPDNIMLCPPFMKSHEELYMLIDRYGRAVRSTEEKVKQLKLKSKQ